MTAFVTTRPASAAAATIASRRSRLPPCEAGREPRGLPGDRRVRPVPGGSGAASASGGAPSRRATSAGAERPRRRRVRRAQLTALGTPRTGSGRTVASRSRGTMPRPRRGRRGPDRPDPPLRVVPAAREADRDAGRDAEVPEHERHRAREVLAVAGSTLGDESDERQVRREAGGLDGLGPRHAHAWVEAWFRGCGWLFNPTPPGRPRAQSLSAPYGAVARLRRRIARRDGAPAAALGGTGAARERGRTRGSPGRVVAGRPSSARDQSLPLRSPGLVVTKAMMRRVRYASARPAAARGRLPAGARRLPARPERRTARSVAPGRLRGGCERRAVRAARGGRRAAARELRRPHAAAGRDRGSLCCARWLAA